MRGHGTRDNGDMSHENMGHRDTGTGDVGTWDIWDMRTRGRGMWRRGDTGATGTRAHEDLGHGDEPRGDTGDMGTRDIWMRGDSAREVGTREVGRGAEGSPALPGGSPSWEGPGAGWGGGGGGVPQSGVPQGCPRAFPGKGDGDSREASGGTAATSTWRPQLPAKAISSRQPSSPPSLTSWPARSPRSGAQRQASPRGTPTPPPPPPRPNSYGPRPWGHLWSPQFPPCAP